METINIEAWEDLLPRIETIKNNCAKRSEVHGAASFLFRGQSNMDWHLLTTLDRAENTKFSFMTYYRLIRRIAPQIAAFTSLTFLVPGGDEYKAWLENDILMPLNLPAYEIMIYLRHHGFPSPLLDWTRSVHIAAFFAFRNVPAEVKRVSLYAYCENPEDLKGYCHGEPTIWRKGPYVNSHRRHFLQQCEYTICIQHNDEWCYAPHESAFDRNDQNQDLLWKFTIPVSERNKVLRLLDSYNINALSLFSSEESLMETLAFRELYCRPL
jgi:hypothetical protein